MIPGKTYVGILPGHTRPAFVRKPPVDAGRPPLFLTQLFGSARRAYSVETARKPSMFCRSRSDVYYDYATARYRPKVFVDKSPGRTITSVQQTCASCGRYRSARWQARHPLIPGTSSRPGLCGKCRYKHTSSEEERPRHRRRRRHHRRCDYTESTDDSLNTSWESKRGARRNRSQSRDYRRRSLARSPSRDNVRIIIANQAGDHVRPERHSTRRREITRSSSMEPARVIRRTEVVELPERPPRTRSILRSSSPTEYVDSATQYIENLDPPRYLSRSRAVSRVSCIEDVEHPRYRSRSRSLSHVSYLELERPRRRSRPRSVSRVSYIEDLDCPRSRRRARSSSQVRFVDETDELVSPSKLRSLKRRRAVYYDGPADNEKLEQQDYIRTPSNHRSLQGIANGDGRAMLIEEPVIPHSRASQKAIEQDRHVDSIEEQSTSCHRPSSRSQEDLDQIPEKVPNHKYRQPSKTRSYTYESDHDATPRPAFRHVRGVQSPDNEEKPLNHGSYIDFAGVRSYRRSYSPSFESRESSRQRVFTGPDTPYRGRRERVRESDESSGPDDDDCPRPSAISYRHVEAPETPAPGSDFLVEMLQNASITPPSARNLRGRPSQRNRSGDLDTASQSYPQRFYPSEDSEDEHTDYGDGRITRKNLHGSASQLEPALNSNAKYDWMT